MGRLEKRMRLRERESYDRSCEIIISGHRVILPSPIWMADQRTSVEARCRVLFLSRRSRNALSYPDGSGHKGEDSTIVEPWGPPDGQNCSSTKIFRLADPVAAGRFPW